MDNKMKSVIGDEKDLICNECKKHKKLRYSNYCIYCKLKLEPNFANKLQERLRTSLAEIVELKKQDCIKWEHFQEKCHEFNKAQATITQRNHQISDLRGRVKDLQFQIDHDKDVAKVDLRDVKEKCSL